MESYDPDSVLWLRLLWHEIPGESTLLRQPLSSNNIALQLALLFDNPGLLWVMVAVTSSAASGATPT